VRDGLTSFQVLQSATVNPAGYFLAEWGIRNPWRSRSGRTWSCYRQSLADIGATRSIVGVMCGAMAKPGGTYREGEQHSSGLSREIQEVERDLAGDPMRGGTVSQRPRPDGSLGRAAVADIARTRESPVPSVCVERAAERAKVKAGVSEAGITTWDTVFLNAKEYSAAAAILRMNAEDFPQSANACDSLGKFW